MRSVKFEKAPILYVPLKVLLSFLVFTEFLVFVGPNVYPLRSPILLILYLLIVNLFFYWGYQRGISKFRPSKYHFKLSTVQIMIILGLVLSIVKLVEMWARRGLAVSLSTVALAIINPGEAYFSESLVTASSGLLTLLLSPITWAALPLGVYKWKNLSFFYRTIVVLIVFIQIITWLGIGTRKGLIDLIIIIGFIVFLNRTKSSSRLKVRKLDVFFVSIAIVSFISYFVFSNLSRYGLTVSEINLFEFGVEIRSFYLNVLPLWFVVSLSNISSYLCQGYYALSIALSEGIISPTIGGISWFTIMIAKMFGYNPLPDTYLSILEQYGIDSHVNWHTIYVWFANDFTFIGVPIIIYIIGMMLARTWCECVKGENDMAIPLFSLFLIMVFYFYANNQVLSFSFMPLVVWWICYRFSRS